MQELPHVPWEWWEGKAGKQLWGAGEHRELCPLPAGRAVTCTWKREQWAGVSRKAGKEESAKGEEENKVVRAQKKKAQRKKGRKRKSSQNSKQISWEGLTRP